MELATHVVQVVARFLEADIRIHTERQTLLLAVEATLEAPPAATGRGDLEVQAAAVEEPVGLLARLRVDDRGVGGGPRLPPSSAGGEAPTSCLGWDSIPLNSIGR
jgi:hypothetical protein